MEFYEKHLETKADNNDLNKPKSPGKCCNFFKDDINNSNWNRGEKKFKAILSNSDSAKTIEMLFTDNFLFQCIFSVF